MLITTEIYAYVIFQQTFTCRNIVGKLFLS